MYFVQSSFFVFACVSINIFEHDEMPFVVPLIALQLVCCGTTNAVRTEEQQV